MTYTEWTKQIGDQWVAALTRVEQGASRAAHTLSEATARTGLPVAADLPLVEHVASLQDAFVSQLPSPEEVIRANFELTARVIEAQHEFALSLLSFGGPTAASTVAPSKPAAKPTKRTESAATKPAAAATDQPTVDGAAPKK